MLSGATSNGSVVLYLTRDQAFLASHEGHVQLAIARMIAELRGATFAGPYDADHPCSRPIFFVPTDTIVGLDHATGMGIRSAADFFGGVVPHDFVKTKVIAHRLVGAGAARPAGWSDAFAAAVQPLVLPGFSAFSRKDADRGVRRLLRQGPVRIKRPLAAGGHGQVVVASAGAAARVLEQIGADELTRFGVVLETNLDDVKTYSVGQAALCGLTVSYYGVQRETLDNAGRTVYGGSDLVLFRGDFDVLLRERLVPPLRRCVSAAIAFDRATRHYPGLLLSRRNYDVGVGRAADGRRRVGVFEQSWRIGGASGAELLAVRAFQEDPRLRRVEASTVEAYGDEPQIPSSADVHFQGDDGARGPLACYAIMQRTAAAAA